MILILNLISKEEDYSCKLLNIEMFNFRSWLRTSLIPNLNRTKKWNGYFTNSWIDKLNLLLTRSIEIIFIYKDIGFLFIHMYVQFCISTFSNNTLHLFNQNLNFKNLTFSQPFVKMKENLIPFQLYSDCPHC